MTDTINGTVTLSPAGTAVTVDFHPFTVQLSGGTVIVTLTAISPSSTTILAVYVGTPSADGSSCSLLSAGAVNSNSKVGSTPALQGTIDAGAYCVGVYDPQLGPGNGSGTVTYTLTVTHA
jgi:hypothetical protein